jgi:uncharacterized protein (TIGR03435 family)
MIRMRTVRCVAVGLAVLLLGLGASRVRAQGSVAGPAMMSKDADPNWEVATVRRSDPDGKEDAFVVVGRHVKIENRPLENLLLIGYGVQKSQIVGAPEWVKTEHFDVDGVTDVDGQPNVLQIQSLMRKLLAERFGLKLHHEQRVMPVYALTLAKGAVKMAASKGDPSGLPDETVYENGGERTLQMTNVTLKDLALMMKVFLDRPVVDQTGLQGRYDFQLEYTFDELRATPDANAAPSVFTAVQEQLGLKLEPTRLAADVVVIDKVERPGAN